MSYNFAIIREQGVTFAVVCVSEATINNTFQAQDTQAAFERRYGMPVALWGDRNRGVYGRPDLVRFLQRLHVSQIPWRRQVG
jgi:hypothetical protein